ncbi:FAD-dependent monooxygenase [Pseudoroseicyclus aestuarii]|uniref:Salicylate hydroxylase n=1 Tax=Pseudoroseicyclus aestuarii TaxID=1795041 RepID=A0A318SQ43_9RHOB|nr:FAD-dependent monooxygenase [Pseudoroseicyclus aestuarii]PYE83981.1 salicylate hydroxylase [Pseudoroseicyclus aestuarii]
MALKTATVVGGGIGGLTVALCLARRGVAVTLLEQAPVLRELGAGLQITPNGARVIQALGLGADLDAVSVQGRAVVPVDGLTGRRLARFDLTRLPGPPYRMASRRGLVALLGKACAEAGVALRTGARVTEATDGVLTLEGGERIEDALVIGADGLHSMVRPALNEATSAQFAGQVAWRAVIPAEQAPEARIWMLPHRHAVTYPIPEGLNIVAVEERSAWAPEGWSHVDRPDAMTRAFSGACAELQDLLQQVREPMLWGLFRHPVARHWHGQRSAILGDAAHPTLPFLAQGANLALEDAWVLAESVTGSEPLLQGLARYQARRRDRVVRALAAAQANARNYHLSGPARRVAHLGLAAIDRVAPRAYLRRLDWLYAYDATRGEDRGS